MWWWGIECYTYIFIKRLYLYRNKSWDWSEACCVFNTDIFQLKWKVLLNIYLVVFPPPPVRHEYWRCSFSLAWCDSFIGSYSVLHSCLCNKCNYFHITVKYLYKTLISKFSKFVNFESSFSPDSICSFRIVCVNVSA